MNYISEVTKLNDRVIKVKARTGAFTLTFIKSGKEIKEISRMKDSYKMGEMYIPPNDYYLLRKQVFAVFKGGDKQIKKQSNTQLLFDF